MGRVYIITWIGFLIKMMEECKDPLEEECAGEPEEPGCFSSLAMFRLRVWEIYMWYKSIVCCC